MIVDDEQDVHSVTTLVLNDFVFMDRQLFFLHAYSAKDAKDLLKRHSDIALILLDVVMEEEHAGLHLVKYIRNTLLNNQIRIILRTGHPGSAPERRVTIDYDINDYKTKSELTAQQLFTTVVSALRSYQFIAEIESNRRGLARLNQSLEQRSREILENKLFIDTILKKNVKQAIVAANMENIITYCNPAAEKMFGYRREDIIGQSIEHILLMEGISSQQFRQMLGSIKGNTEFSIVTERPTGQGMASIEVKISNVLDLDNNTAGMVLIGEDVSRFQENLTLLALAQDLLEKSVGNNSDAFTESIQELASLAHSSRKEAMEYKLRLDRFISLAEALPTLIWLSDTARQTFLFVNSACEDIWGVSTIIAKQNPSAILQKIDCDDRKSVISALNATPQKGYDLEYKITLPDGSVRGIWERAIPYQDADGKTLLVGISEDITDWLL